MVTPILREWYVVLSIAFPALSGGILRAFPASLIPGISANNSDIGVTKDAAVWVATTYNISGIFSFIILPLIMQHYGRRVCNLFVHTFIIIGSITVALSQNITTLIIGQCFQGMACGSIIVSGIFIAEYSHPKRRGMFTIFKILIYYFGVLLLHGLSFVLTWRQLAWLCVAPSAYGVVTTFTWPESPFWLAYKGRSNDCIEAFELLRSRNEESHKELQHLLLAQSENDKRNRKYNVFKKFIKAMTTKDFLLPLSIAFFNSIVIQASGLAYLIAYVIEIMQQMTNGDRTMALYFTLGFDLMKITSALTALRFERLMKRRTWLFSGATVAIVLLLIVCLLQYLIEINVLSIIWLAPLCLILYNFFCNVAVIPAVILIAGEIFPLQYKGFGLSMLGVVETSMAALTIKCTPIMLTSLKLHGTLLVYTLIMVGSLFCVYFILPETKDRPLQDIESEFVNVTINVEDKNKVFDTMLLMKQHVKNKEG